MKLIYIVLPIFILALSSYVTKGEDEDVLVPYEQQELEEEGEVIHHEGEDRSYYYTEQAQKRVSGGNHQVAFDYVTDPQNSIYYFSLFTTMFVASQLVLIAAHFLFWDYNDTRNSEKFTPVNLYNFLTNPDRALENIYITLGHSAAQIILWTLPTLLWTGEEIDNGIDEDADEGDDRLFASPIVRVEGNFRKGLRRMLSPNQTATNLLINTVIFIGTLAWWNFSPYLRRKKHDYHDGRKKRDTSSHSNVDEAIVNRVMENIKMECLSDERNC